LPELFSFKPVRNRCDLGARVRLPGWPVWLMCLASLLWHIYRALDAPKQQKVRHLSCNRKTKDDAGARGR